MTLPDLTQLTLLALEATRVGDAKTLRGALDAGVSVDARDARGDSLLMLASRYGHVDLARLLLERGADRSLRDAPGD